MRTKIAGALILLALAGCDEGAPPLDDLPLRDALRADPAVIATLSDDARQRLAARLEAARTSDDASDPVAGDPATTPPAALVAEVDAARVQRASDALIVGAIGSGVARALPQTTAREPAALPPLEIDASAPALTALESRALQGNAAATVRALLAATGAHHLRRAVGWPIGAVAIDDTVYVGAAWLAALAPASGADGGADAGAPGMLASSGAVLATGGAAADTTAPVTANVGSDGPDGGAVRATPATDNVGASYPGSSDGGVIVVYPPSTPQPLPTSSSSDSCGATADSCAACSAASTDNSDSCDGNTSDGTDDSCNNTGDGTDDSCNNTGDGSDNSCNNTGDGTDGTNCQVSHHSREHGGTSPRMMISLFAPLAFLFSRRRR